MNLNSNVVYKIKCNTCGAYYVGQTKQRLRDRVTQHKSDIRVKPKACALANHVATLDHIIDFNNAEVLYRESNYTKRLFLETLAIQLTQNTINSKTTIPTVLVTSTLASNQCLKNTSTKVLLTEINIFN